MAVWLCTSMAACGTVTLASDEPTSVGMKTAKPARPRFAPSTVTLMGAPPATARPEVGPVTGEMEKTLGGAYV